MDGVGWCCCLIRLVVVVLVVVCLFVVVLLLVCVALAYFGWRGCLVAGVWRFRGLVVNSVVVSH